MRASVTVELKPDTVDAIVLTELTEHLRGCENDVRALQAKAAETGGLKDYEREDLANFEDSIAALRIVRRLYQRPSEWD